MFYSNYSAVYYPARCFGMNMPKSRDIQVKIPLPQAIWNEFWLRYCERSEQQHIFLSLPGNSLQISAVCFRHIHLHQIIIHYNLNKSAKPDIPSFALFIVLLLLFTRHYPARCFGMNMPKSRDIQAKIPLPQAIWNEFWLRY